MTDRKQALIDLRDKVRAGDRSASIKGTPIKGYGHLYEGCLNGSLDAAKALRLALNLHVPKKMHSDARIELLNILKYLIAQEDQREQ